MKGWELAIFYDKDKCVFSFLPGTNREKTEEEILSSARSIQDLKAKLLGLKANQWVMIATKDNCPTKDEKSIIENTCVKTYLHCSYPWATRPISE